MHKLQKKNSLLVRLTSAPKALFSIFHIQIIGAHDVLYVEVWRMSMRMNMARQQNFIVLFYSIESDYISDWYGNMKL
jgi:hypothetical protein